MVSQEQNRRKLVNWSSFHLVGVLTFLLLSFVLAGASGAKIQGSNQTRRPDANYCRVFTERGLRIELQGLFFFSFYETPGGSDTRSEFRAGILSTREDHNLYVRYNHYDDPAKPDRVLVDTTLVFPHAALQSMSPDIVVDTTAARPPGATLHNHIRPNLWGVPSPRTKADHDPYDFNWVIDFEGPELYNANLELKPNKLRPILRFKVGEFYTEQLSDRSFYAVQDGKVKEFGYVAKTTGVCIPLATDEQLVITGISDTAILIPRETTVIQLYNVRPKDWPGPVISARATIQSGPTSQRQDQTMQMLSAAGIGTEMTHLDELQIFYDDLLELAGRTRTHFIPIKGPEISLPFVCYGGGGSINR